jgi:hypothetical protein
MKSKTPLLFNLICLEVYERIKNNGHFGKLGYWEGAVKRFSQKVEVIPDGCWVWLGSKNKYGYGVVSINKEHLYVHRFMFSCVHGGLTPGMIVYQLCNVRTCVNPDHLEEISVEENVKRQNKRRASYGT